MKIVPLKKENRILIPQCSLATNFFTRFFGLMGRSTIGREEAIFFPRCNSIHTFFMRMPIDVVFVSTEGEVIDIKHSLKPWRLLFPITRAAHTLEMRAQLAQELGIARGDRLDLDSLFEGAKN